MGIGVQALLLMKFIQDAGYLKGKKSIMELGSQQFAPDLPAARRAIGEFFPELDATQVHLPQNFYHLLGLTDYACIDLDGANNAYQFNLNLPLNKKYDFDSTFDVVTNHGTTEHAFGQFQCFANVHRMTKPDGLMIHALPSQGYQNHSFFNYHPSFFMDLASANNYDLLGMYYNLDERLFPYTDDFLQKHGILATENLAVFAVLRKRGDDRFIVPFDGRYYFEQSGTEFKPRVQPGSHGRIQKNTLPLSGEMASSKLSRRASIKFVLPVWGDLFTPSFVTFALRQQIAGNCLAIDDRDNIEYLIVTDAPSAALIRESDEYNELRKLVRVRFLLNEGVHDQHNYNRLTDCYNLALREAKVNDLFIFITADCFFSREVFHRVKELSQTHRVILSPALRVTEESFIAEVNASNAFDISGAQAIELAMRHEHPLTEAFCINNSRGVMHPLPAQTISRVSNGYVGRWNVMHPLAIRISNLTQPITATIDFAYPLLHMRDWNDVAVLDSIEDGLTVSLTPFNYDQGEPIQKRRYLRSYAENLKAWVSIPWALDFHMAQISHPVRLTTSQDANGAEIASAEQDVERVVNDFLGYVNSRKLQPRSDFRSLRTVDLLRPAVDRRESSRLLAHSFRKSGRRFRRFAARVRNAI